MSRRWEACRALTGSGHVFIKGPLFADAGRQRLSPIKVSHVDERDISAGVANTGKLALVRVPIAGGWRHQTCLGLGQTL